MRIRHLLLDAPALRALLEALLVGVLLWLSLLLFHRYLSPITLQLIYSLLIGPVCMLLYILRLRLPANFLHRESILDAAIAFIFSLVLSCAELAFILLLQRSGTFIHRIVKARAPLAWQANRIEVVAEVPSALPPALVDANRLEQALQNLLHNAVRHTSPGGIVAVAVAAEPEALVLHVKDTGEGIAPQDLPRIWERFYQAKNAGNGIGTGTGLGLALVKEWIEAMGGSVAAESVLGEGSCFTIRLPQAL